MIDCSWTADAKCTCEMESLSSPYPLRSVSETQLKKLCQTLWNWQLCGDCESARPCMSTSCPWQRSKRLAGFFDYYREITASYVPELQPGTIPALRTHEDILEIIQALKAEPDLPRSQLTQDYFSN